MNLKGQRNQCRGCDQYFNSNKAFDKHRRGQPGHDRRCLTPEEMLAKGMSLNIYGFWVTMAMADKAAKVLKGDRNGE